jgi:hypothetical protein
MDTGRQAQGAGEEACRGDLLSGMTQTAAACEREPAYRKNRVRQMAREDVEGREGPLTARDWMYAADEERRDRCDGEQRTEGRGWC